MSNFNLSAKKINRKDEDLNVKEDEIGSCAVEDGHLANAIEALNSNLYEIFNVVNLLRNKLQYVSVPVGLSDEDAKKEEPEDIQSPAIETIRSITHRSDQLRYELLQILENLRV